MTASNNDLWLRVNGLEYGGWVGGTVTKSIRSMSGQFSLSVNDRWPGLEEFWAIDAGASCELVCSEDVLINGYVDTVAAEHYEKDKEITISGRDKSGDLVDCSAPDKEWNNTTLDALCRDICSPFSIQTIGTHGGRFDISSDDDSCATLIERAAKKVGALVWFDGAALRISDTPIIGDCDDVLEMGVNVKSMTYTKDKSETFSHITVKGQNRGFGDSASLLQNVVESEMRYRPKIITQFGESSVRAEMAASIMLAKEETIDVTLAGLRQSSGKLWKPGFLAHVRGPFVKKDDPMLIESVTYSFFQHSGTTTTLKLVHQDSYQAVADKRKQRQQKLRVVQ